jgi:2-alkyl-3-oxoalkanoate reductase
MTILVTGSNGFLGSTLVRRLLESGESNIRCLVRPGSNRERLEALEAKFGDKFHYLTGTLSKQEDCVKALEGDVDQIYHLASAMSGAPADMFFNSVVASKNLMEALVATKRSIKVTHCSSFGVYGVADLSSGALVDENTPLESQPEKRDPYSHTKLRQELLLWKYHRDHGFPLTVLRPGVIYGAGGPAMSGRVGLNLFGIFLYLGRNNKLPLTYVDNCADAIIYAMKSDGTDGQAYNVVDDDIPSAWAFLKRYRKNVAKSITVPLPYFATRLMSVLVKKYHEHSDGQLPAVFTPYKSDSMWKGNRFTNAKLKSLGWKQEISTEDGLAKHFAYLKQS